MGVWYQISKSTVRLVYFSIFYRTRNKTFNLHGLSMFKCYSNQLLPSHFHIIPKLCMNWHTLIWQLVVKNNEAIVLCVRTVFLPFGRQRYNIHLLYWKKETYIIIKIIICRVMINTNTHYTTNMIQHTCSQIMILITIILHVNATVIHKSHSYHKHNHTVYSV